MEDIQFQPVKKYLTAGMYSKNQLEAFSNFITHPMRVKSANEYITNSIVENHKPKEKFKITNLLSSDELNEIKNNFLQEAEKKILRFGSIMGAITGIVLIVQAVAAVISFVINFRFLKATLGCGTHLLASMFTALTNFVIRNNVHKKEEEEKSEDHELKKFQV